MCPYGIIYNILHALPWPALVGYVQPWLDTLRAKRAERKAARHAT